MNIQFQPIRETTVLLVFRTVFFNFLIEAIYLTIRIFALDLNTHFIPHRDITYTFLLFLASLYVIQGFMIMVFIQFWTHRYYYIEADKLTERKGIFTRTERVYELKNTKSVILHQDFLGHLFHYGTVTITITSPNIKEDLILVNVSQASEIAEYIKQFLH